MSEISLKEHLSRVRKAENDIYLMNSFENYCHKIENHPRIKEIYKDLEDCKHVKEKKSIDWGKNNYNYLKENFIIYKEGLSFPRNVQKIYEEKSNKLFIPKSMPFIYYILAFVCSAIIPVIFLFAGDNPLWLKILAIIIGIVIFRKVEDFYYEKNLTECILEEVADYSITALNNELEDINKTKTTLLNKLDALRIPMDTANKRLIELYNQNIIFPKYRNIIAVNQISEYLDSGRCSELEGPNGAYNLYESELRQNIIIDKLDTVINQLDQIRQNQYYIYQAIRDTQNAIDNMNISVVTNTYIDGVRY